jgi:uncharacterized phage infection (PIP) family protein YhgE
MFYVSPRVRQENTIGRTPNIFLLFIILVGVFYIVILGIYVQAVIGSCRYSQSLFIFLVTTYGLGASPHSPTPHEAKWWFRPTLCS